jgi:hypothetical protein
MPIVEQARRYKLFMTMLQISVQIIKNGPNGTAAMDTQLVTFPVSIRWDVTDWVQAEVGADKVNVMYQVATQLSIGMSAGKFTEHLFKQTKELFPGRRFMVSVGGYIIENQVSQAEEKLIMPLNLVGNLGKEEQK